MAVMLQLSAVIDEIHYRLHQDNHGTGLFEKRFTTMIDCCPIWVAEPTDPFWADLLFQGKYGGSCFKIQIGINWLGWIVLFTGLHVGTKTDDEIWHATAAEHPFEHWEWWLGDAAYSTCVGVLTRHVQDPHSVLWQDEAHVNAYLNFYRQYVEHSMHLIKDHGMWRVVNSRNSLPVLQACIKITVHLTNVAIKRPWLPVFARRYPGFYHGTPHYP